MSLPASGSIMSFIRMPPMLAPDHVESWPHPEALETGSEQRACVHTNDFLPEFSTPGERWVPPQGFHQAPAEFGEQGKGGDGQHRHHNNVHDRGPSGKKGDTRR